MIPCGRFHAVGGKIVFKLAEKRREQPDCLLTVQLLTLKECQTDSFLCIITSYLLVTIAIATEGLCPPTPKSYMEILTQGHGVRGLWEAVGP